MNMKSVAEVETENDAILVQRCLGGDREAFGRIVERYQALICALTYNACGNVARSEDLAQETFIAAWRGLRDLHDPARLKSWLCGIARNLILNARRREGRDPVAASEPIETALETVTADSAPPDRAITAEEETILWRVLDGLPANYREPLILYYRQQHSVAETAAALGLSEEATKQRLSRGRALLNERVAKFVEATLIRTNPTRAFTLGVLAALPVMVSSASAATLGAVAAKGSATQAIAGIGLIGALLGPVAGVLGAWYGIKASIASAKTPADRTFLIKNAKLACLFALAFAAALAGWLLWGQSLFKSHPIAFAIGLFVLILSYVLGLLGFILWSNRARSKLLESEKVPSAHLLLQPVIPFYEYRSKCSFLGWPLMHIRTGGTPAGRWASPAIGWLAFGDYAIGAISMGGVAIGGLCLGGCAVGVIPIGGAALGLLAFGGLAIGGWAMGGAALGYIALGGVALGWKIAFGGLAVAHEYALGGAAFAQYANNEIAQAYIKQQSLTGWVIRSWNLVQLLIWAPMLLFVWPIVQLRKHLRKNGSA